MEAVTVVEAAVVVVAVGIVKDVGTSVVVEAGMGAAFVAVLVTISEAEAVAEVVVGWV